MSKIVKSIPFRSFLAKMISCGQFVAVIVMEDETTDRKSVVNGFPWMP